MALRLYGKSCGSHRHTSLCRMPIIVHEYSHCSQCAVWCGVAGGSLVASPDCIATAVSWSRWLGPDHPQYFPEWALITLHR